MDSKICVLGLGYIGLPTASVLAVHGYWVIGVDVNPRVVETINKGGIHIYEPGLETLVNAATCSGHLVARSTPETADVFIIAVPTPVTDDKKADLSAVQAASESIVPFLRKGNLVILESTVSPGTTNNLVTPILECSGLKAGDDFQVVHAPERVLPGQILRELVQNDRILGGITPEAAQRAKEIYSSFVSGDIYLTDATSAEMVKLVENTFRDVNIALANELAQICDQLGISVWEIIGLANKHPRVQILQPGPGVGGHCIPVDPWFIVEKAPGLAGLIQQGRKVNDSMPHYVSHKIMSLLQGIPEPVVTVLGLSYKVNVDDIRESPSFEIIAQLEACGCKVQIHDPYVHPDISIEHAAENSDCIALIVNHKEYEDLSPHLFAGKMRSKNFFFAKEPAAISDWLKEGFKVAQLGNGASIVGQV
jgi:UDP-N-acetyl-D-mannosaminuronic acid dehydrogenase